MILLDFADSLTEILGEKNYHIHEICTFLEAILEEHRWTFVQFLILF